MTIPCEDCGEPTYNRTERCGLCRIIWRKNMQSQEVIDHKLGKTIEVDGKTMKIVKEYSAKVKFDGTPICVECEQESLTIVDGVCNTCLSKKNEEDVIDWPKHYNAGKIQPIDAIEDWKLDFRLANAVKYIARHEHKGTAKKDLEKAIWYIQRYIDKELSNEQK